MKLFKVDFFFSLSTERSFVYIIPQAGVDKYCFCLSKPYPCKNSICPPLLGLLLILTVGADEPGDWKVIRYWEEHIKNGETLMLSRLKRRISIFKEVSGHDKYVWWPHKARNQNGSEKMKYQSFGSILV